MFQKDMNNKTPFFSIVMANFNGDRYLEDAILSVLEQSCQDFELIIIDGASTDNSVSIIKKYDKRLAYWVSEKDKGQSDAFNKGFARAKGFYYFWLNSDDLLLPGSLDFAKIFINKYPNFKWFAANTVFINESNIILSCARGPDWRDFFVKNGVIYVYGPSSIFHRDLFEEVGGFDLNLYYTMDTDLWMRFKNKGYKFKRLSYYFWSFRIHIDSKTSHSFYESPNSAFKEEQKFIEFKNNHFYFKTSYLKQIFLKLFSGSYLVSKLDSLIFRGKDVNCVKLNK